MGLSAQELNDLEPEAAWRRTVEAIQQMPDVTARAALAEEVFGGTSEKLAGIVNMTAGEFAELEKNVAATADVVSEQDLANAKALTMNMNEMKASIGKAFTTLGTAVIPVLNKLFDGIKEAIPVLRDTFAPVFEALKELWQDLQPTLADLGDTLVNDLLPALQSIWQSISPVLIPALKLLVGIIGEQLQTAFAVISGVLRTVAALLRGDFAGAWQAIQETVLKVVKNMADIANKFLGLFGKEIDTSGLDKALADIEAEARGMAEGADEAADATEDLGEAAEETTRELAPTGERWRRWNRPPRMRRQSRGGPMADALSTANAAGRECPKQRPMQPRVGLPGGTRFSEVEKAERLRIIAPANSRDAAIMAEKQVLAEVELASWLWR